MDSNRWKKEKGFFRRIVTEFRPYEKTCLYMCIFYFVITLIKVNSPRSLYVPLDVNRYLCIYTIRSISIRSIISLENELVQRITLSSQYFPFFHVWSVFLVLRGPIVSLDSTWKMRKKNNLSLFLVIQFADPAIHFQRIEDWCF